MIKLGITGGIGSGKSYISHLLIQQGIPVFDCDSQAKLLTATSSVIRAKLIELLGESVYIGAELNKPVLASYLFASKENAQHVNEIIHPCVRETFHQWCKDYQSKGVRLIAMESAILYESGFSNEVDKVVMVYAPMDVRCKRVIERDHTTREAVEARIASQMSDEEKCRLADYIVENDGEKQLQKQLDELFLILKYRKDDK